MSLFATLQSIKKVSYLLYFLIIYIVVKLYVRSLVIICVMLLNNMLMDSLISSKMIFINDVLKSVHFQYLQNYFYSLQVHINLKYLQLFQCSFFYSFNVYFLNHSYLTYQIFLFDYFDYLYANCKQLYILVVIQLVLFLLISIPFQKIATNLLILFFKQLIIYLTVNFSEIFMLC